MFWPALSMSSSRRSSTRSKGILTPPVWRSMTASKQSTPCVSLISAEPEQGAPLASAITNLPAPRVSDGPTSDMLLTERPSGILQDPVPPDPDVKGNLSDLAATSLPTAEARRGQSDVAPLQGNPKVASDSFANVSSPEQMAMVSAEVISPTEVPPPTPSSLSTSQSSQSSPRRTTWFGSLSRSKGKEKASALVEAHGGKAKDEGTCRSNSETPVIDTTPIPSNFSSPMDAEAPTAAQAAGETAVNDSESLHSQPQTISQQTQTQTRGWLSSSAPPTTPKSPIPLDLSSASVTSSLDEELPELRPPLPVPIQAIVNSDDADRRRLSSLNSSTSRFILSIPLLGRPKIPLDQVVAVSMAGEFGKNNQSHPPNWTSTSKIGSEHSQMFSIYMCIH
jgi:hypothetical protein